MNASSLATLRFLYGGLTEWSKVTDCKSVDALERCPRVRIPYPPLLYTEYLILCISYVYFLYRSKVSVILVYSVFE